MPDCWTRLSTFQVNATTLRPNLYTYGGGKVLNFNGQGSGSGVMQIATPFIASALNNMEITFRCSGAGLMLYAAPDTADESTWVLIGTFGSGSSWSWVNVELHTDTISGMPSSNGFLVYASAYGSSYGTGRLDDLVVTALTACDKPASVSAENVGPATATISWDAVDGVPSYLVYYKADGDDDWVEIEEYTTSTDLANLQPGTTYTVKVRSLCGSNDTSDARSTTFTTQNSCYAINNIKQVNSGFDAASVQWELSGQGYAASNVLTVLHDITDPFATDVVEPAQSLTSHIFTGLNREHKYMAFFYTICGEDTTQSVSVNLTLRQCGESPLNAGVNDYSASYPLGTSYLTSYTLALYDADILYGMDTLRGIALHRAQTASSAALTRTISIYIGHTTLDSLTSNIGTTGMTQVANGVSYTLAAQEWDTLLFTTPFVYDGYSNVLVALQDNTGIEAQIANWYYHASEGRLFYSNHGSYGDNSAGVYRQPDLRFVGDCNSDMSCATPVAAVGNVEGENAEVYWIGTSGINYVIEYRQQGENAWIVADTVGVSNYTLHNLNPGNYYEVRVGAICGPSANYTEAIGFATNCAEIHLPYDFTQNNMCAMADNGLSPCLNVSQRIYRGRTTYSNRGHLRNAGSNTWIMLPAIANPLKYAQLSTWAASSSECSFMVGITDNDNISGVVWIDTVSVVASNPNESHDVYTVDFLKYNGTGDRIVISPIVSNEFQYLYFFDFHVESTIPVIYDTIIVNVDVPYAVHDTTYVDIHDTTYVAVHDTTMVFDTITEYVSVHDTAIVMDTVFLTAYIHDTTVVTEHDTTYLPVYIHDTSYVNVHDTTYLPVYLHDTAYVDVPVHDTIIVRDTTYIDVPYAVHDTTIVRDTTYIDVPYAVHDTTYITLTDTVTNTVYDTVTNTVYDTVDNYIYDTVTVTDTLWLTQTDTLWLHDTVTVHDTVYVTGEGIDGAEALNAKVYSSHGQVVVEGADGNTVALYDVNGRLLARKEESGERSVFDVTASGTYMIKIGHYPARKVVVVR